MRFEERQFCSTKEGFEWLGVGSTKGWDLVGRGVIKAVRIDGATKLSIPSLLEAAQKFPTINCDDSLSEKVQRAVEAHQAARDRAKSTAAA
jgi:hypothetical protein